MNTARALIPCTVALLIGGCHQDAGAPQAAPNAPRVNAPAVVKRGPGAEELTAGMVEATSQGKSQLPVKLKFDLRERPAIGQPLDIDVAVLPQIDAIAGDIQVTGGDGLTVAPGANQLELPAVEAGQVYRQDVKVTPSGDGVLLLSLTVSLKRDDQTDSRVFSIPLIVER